MFFVFKFGENPGNPHTLYSRQTGVMDLFRELKIAGKWRTTTEGYNL